MTTWTTPTPRKTERKLRAETFLKQDGKCACCTQKLHIKGWILDHIIPLADGGADDETNLQAICVPCSKGKTSTEATERAEYRQKRDKHCGIMPKSKSAMPFGRNDRRKKKMNGQVVDRYTGEPI